MNNRIRHFLLSNTPEFILNFAKSFKKKLRRKQIKNQASANKGFTLKNLVDDLIRIGLKKDDSVLVHSSLSKIGFVEEGPAGIIKALEDVIGDKGTLLMPAFTASGKNKDYLESNPVFDIKNTPSKMGIVTEYFRTLPNVNRSFHPTDSVCACGPLAEYFTNTHFRQITPYNEFSPFRKLAEKKGKILMLGTTLNGAGTNLHTLEDAVDFKFPVYDDKIYNVQMIDSSGKEHHMNTKVHNPAYSVKRNCDALKPIFEKENVLRNGKIGEADCMLIDAEKLLEVMIRYYNAYGVTMYTPFGENNKLADLK